MVNELNETQIAHTSVSYLFINNATWTLRYPPNARLTEQEDECSSMYFIFFSFSLSFLKTHYTYQSNMLPFSSREILIYP